MDNTILNEKNIIEDQINNFDSVPAVFNVYGHFIEVAIFDDLKKEVNFFTDTLIFDTINQEEIPFRKLFVIGNTTDKQNSYSISIMKDQSNQINLIENIFSALLTILVLFLLVLISVNYWITRQVWVPFHTTLKKISDYDLLKGSKLRLPFGRVDEFRKLNRVIEKMTDKIYTDYINLKEFNENASHETQTPIAIIKSKIEIMLQSDGLDLDTQLNIKAIYDATNRLSKLNQGLLLISKIDNEQFSETQSVKLHDIIQNFLSNFEELLRIKNIEVEFDSQVSLSPILINKTLAEILISNLISNAIRHNEQNGQIKIILRNGYLEVKNTGQNIDFNANDIFERFRKGAKKSDSVGLGLSIVKRVVNAYNFKIEYENQDGWHSMKITF